MTGATEAAGTGAVALELSAEAVDAGAVALGLSLSETAGSGAVAPAISAEAVLTGAVAPALSEESEFELMSAPKNVSIDSGLLLLVARGRGGA